MGDARPWGYLAFGAGLALVLAACRVQVMPFAIGLYLPIGLNATIFVGGLVRHFVDRRRGERSESEDSGVLLSAGLIAGEGLCGILLAVLTLIFR